MVIGLTGGIACGKTTVSKFFQSFGATIIDLDALGHFVLKNDNSVYEKIVARFGKSILNEYGEIDRSKLGRIVFDNEDELKFLNRVVHPAITILAKSKIEQELLIDKNKIIVLEAVLLIECNLEYMVDLIVLVYADEETQIQRLIKRGLHREDALKRIRSQMPYDKKKQFADFVIYNNGCLSDTFNQAKQFWDEIVLKYNICLNLVNNQFKQPSF